MQFLLTTAVMFTFGFALLQCGGATANTNAVNSATAAKTTSTTTSAPAEPEDNAPRIQLAEAKAAFDAGEALFIDTRAAEAYKEEHIKGAINMPVETFESRYSEVPKDKKIIAYCS